MTPGQEEKKDIRDSKDDGDMRKRGVRLFQGQMGRESRCPREPGGILGLLVGGAFTLVELLVVVAIVGILAGIALPNFLEAQTRSKVSRVKSDLRTVAAGLEAYSSDHNRYPPSAVIPRAFRLHALTTPVAYLSTIPPDVFKAQESGFGPMSWRGTFAYGARPIDQESLYALSSNGPDLLPNHEPIEFYPGYSNAIWENPASGFDYIRYDPTNGTISLGDIWRVSDFQMQ